MKREISYRPNLLLILYCINIFIIFLVPFTKSHYEGDNTAHLHIIINFTVRFFGNWVENIYFSAFHDVDTYTGVAADIGNFSKSIIPFFVLGMIFNLLGASLVGAKKVSNETNLKRIKQITLLRFTGSILSIIGGVFGTVSLLFFSLYKSSIILPYDAKGFIPAGSSPAIVFASGFIICMIIFNLFIIVGIVMVVLSSREIKQNNIFKNSSNIKTRSELIEKKEVDKLNDKKGNLS